MKRWVGLVATTAAMGGCDFEQTGFDSLPEVGIYSVSIEPIDSGCSGTTLALATAGEKVAIEAFADGSYAELRILVAASDSDDDDVATDEGDVVLGRLDTATFYARRETGPSECSAALTQELFGAISESVEITASTRWTGLTACDGIATPGWELPGSDCDTTEIYDFVLDEECENPCSLAYEERVIGGVRRDQPTCSCPEDSTEGEDAPTQ